MSTAFDWVRKIIVEELDVDETAVTLDASIIDDLGADSLDELAMLAIFEAKFNIDIPDAEAENIKTVGDAVMVAQRYVREDPDKIEALDDVTPRAARRIPRGEARWIDSVGDVVKRAHALGTIVKERDARSATRTGERDGSERLVSSVNEYFRKNLVPLEASMWSEEEVPLSQRGVRLSWLFSFIKGIWDEINNIVHEVWEQYGAAKSPPYGRADDYAPPGWTPQVDWFPAFSTNIVVEKLSTTSQLVSELIVPLTSPIKAPLYARVPAEHRGRPSVFISHTWSSNTLWQGAGHGSFDVLLARIHQMTSQIRR